MIKKISLFLCLSVWAGSSNAAVLNGVDLLTDPRVSFPTYTPVINGSSIIFEHGGQAFDKLMVVDLFAPGQLSSVLPKSLSVSLNLTRLGCVPDPDCPTSPEDWDPHIMLTDGSSLIGAVVSDNNSGDALIAELDDAGAQGANRVLTPLFTNAGFPNIGESIDVEITWTFNQSNTDIDVAFLAGSSSYTSSYALDYTSAIQLVFLRDNDIGEEYQLNTITLPSPVPIPAAVWLFGTGLLGLFGVARRKSNA